MREGSLRAAFTFFTVRSRALQTGPVRMIRTEEGEGLRLPLRVHILSAQRCPCSAQGQQEQEPVNKDDKGSKEERVCGFYCYPSVFPDSWRVEPQGIKWEAASCEGDRQAET